MSLVGGQRSYALLVAVVAMAAIGLAACDNDNSNSGAFQVVLLGDESRHELLSELMPLQPGGVAFSTPGRGSSAMDVADSAAAADFALLVTDATVGPTPIVREHVILARQLRIPTVGLLLSKTDELLEVMDGDRDLHDLVELELRELLSTYELPGDSAPSFYDSDTFDPSSGTSALIAELDARRFPIRTPESPASKSGSILISEIYLLSEPEAPGVEPISPGRSLSIWIGGHRTGGQADIAAVIRPGEASQMTLRLASELSSSPGARFFIESHGELVGVGTVITLE